MDSSIFFLGGSASGVGFHKHADAWNGVIFGRKRWFLYPPQKTPPGGKIEFAHTELIGQVEMGYMHRQTTRNMKQHKSQATHATGRLL